MKPLRFCLKQFMLLCFVIGLINIQAQVTDPGSVVKDRSTNRLNTKTEEGVEQGLNKLEEGIGNVFKKKKQSKEEGEAERSEDAQLEEEEMGTPPQDKVQKLESYTQYDFVPGDQILYFEDFSQDAIGDFPALWTSNGGGEVKTINIAPGHWFHMNVEDAVYCYGKEIPFPENYILEFDVIPNSEYEEFELTLYQDATNEELDNSLFPGEMGLHIYPNSEYGGSWMTKGYDDERWYEGNSDRMPIVKEQINHIIIWIQKRRVRIYHQGAKVLDMPTNTPPNTKFNRLRFSTRYNETKPYISNIKITTASPDTRSKLLTEGKLISYGIYFDTGKDQVKPQSYGALKEIAAVLAENPGVRIKVFGHTDSDGDESKNMDLSLRRSKNVKSFLVQEFKIDEGRIEAEGMGENQPIDSNSTTEGKARNRRVEFIKL